MIEVLQTKQIPGGIQVLARAFKGDKQIGFGKDGTVDIEKFNIYTSSKLSKKAILESLEHIVGVKKEKGDDSNIIKGKKGSTTSTFFPAAGTNAPVDGFVRRSGVNETFSTIRAGAGNGAGDSSTQFGPALNASATTDQFEEMNRNGFGFDTSPIDIADIVSSATISFHSDSNLTGLGDTDIDVVLFTPASESAIATGDFVNFGTTRFATGIAVTAWNNGSYTDYTLNASGLANISQTGNDFFGLRTKWDVDNSFTGTWSSSAVTRVNPFFADEAGTAKDPKLVVEHGALAFIPQIIII